jgi:hypothetical protein
MDKFTWAVVAVVILLLVGAILTLSFTGNRVADTQAYLDEDSPAATVHNAYVALLKNDPITARSFYSADVLAEADRDKVFENRFSGYYGPASSQRLRILEVEMRGDEAALVTIAIDRYNSGGPFGGGSTWTEHQTISLVREDGQWKIDTAVFFY